MSNENFEQDENLNNSKDQHNTQNNSSADNAAEINSFLHGEGHNAHTINVEDEKDSQHNHQQNVGPTEVELKDGDKDKTSIDLINTTQSQEVSKNYAIRREQYMKIYEIILTVLSLFLFYICDYISFGMSLFTAADGIGKEELTKMYTTWSFYAYFVTNSVANVVYWYFSSLKTSITAGIIMEANTIHKQMTENAHKCMEASLTMGGATPDPTCVATQSMITGWVSCFLATLGFGLISILIAKKKMGNVMRNVPLLAVNSTMAALGLTLFLDPKDSIQSFFRDYYVTAEIAMEKSSKMYYAKYAGALLCIYAMVVTVYMIDYFFSFSYLLPVVAAVLIILENSCWYATLRYKCPLFEDFFFPKGTSLKMPPMAITGENVSGFAVGGFFSGIISNFGPMISVILFNLIHLNVNVPSYISVVGEKYTKNMDFNTEWKTQGIGSLITSIMGYTVYFVNCYSCLGHKLQCMSPYVTLSLGLVLLAMAVPICLATKYIPNAVGQVFMGLLGIGFLKDYFYDTFKVINKRDRIIMCLGICFSYFMNMAQGFCFVMVMIMLFILMAEIKKSKTNTNGVMEIEDEKVVRINYPAYFLTQDDFVNDLAQLQENCTLDLSECSYMDMGANLALEAAVDKVGIINVVGTPENMYTKIFKKKVNILG